MAYVTDKFDDEVVRRLQGGGVGLVPTDTIYGLSCLALDNNAVGRAHKLKSRDSSKPFIVLISNLKMLDLLSISPNQAAVMKKYWPGAISLILEAAKAPSWLHGGTGLLAVRWPDRNDLTSLIDKTGPIISTSANLSGNLPANSVQEAKAIFGDKLDFYIDAGSLDANPQHSPLPKMGN